MRQLLARVSNGFRSGGDDASALALFVLLAAAIAFGGASRQHELRLAFVELLALPVGLMAIVSLSRRKDLIGHRFAFGLAGAIALLPLVQLIPLPPSIWTSLPGRNELSIALDLSGVADGWLPLSLTPDRTWRSFLALLPPMAMLAGVLTVRPEHRIRLVQLLLIATILSILLGTAQLASGNDRLYPWATTAAGNVSGFFANRNHLADLCLVGMPFATVLGVGAYRKSRGSNLPLWLTALYLGLTAIALGVIRSRSGVVLFAPALGFSLLAAWVASGRGRPQPTLLALIGGATVAIAAVAAFAAAPLLARFDSGGSADGRFENWPTVIEAASAHLPLGSGLGSFDAVYRSVEPLERLDATFFNQAHNDYLETWLEAGWLGAALIVAFLVWFARRAWTAWSAGVSTARDLQRAASIAIGVILLHSIADYPARTAAIATVLAMCCGLLELAIRSDSDSPTSRRRRAT